MDDTMPSTSPRRSRSRLAMAAAFVVLIAVVGGALYLWGPFRFVDPHYLGMNLKAIAMVSPSEGWAVGETSRTPASVFLHYTHQHWTLDQDASSALDPSVTLTSVSMVSATEGWAVGGINVPDATSKGSRVGGIIVHYHDGHWRTDTVLRDQGTAPLQAVAFRSASDGWAAGFGGVVLHYDGTTWHQIALTALQTGSVEFAFTRIALTPAGAWFGGFDVLLHYDGARWSRGALPAGAVVHGLALDDAANGVALLALADDGPTRFTDVWRYLNGQEAAQTQSPFHNLTDFSANGVGWAVGSDGGIARITPDTWQPVASPTNAPLNAVAMVNADEAWAVGNWGTIVHERHGTWDAVALG